ncbi:short-chain dehydrogenase [Paenibacillus sp. IHB B 3415]|uniref:SDR family oxidoreductase n=1 Tax=Paenibacillus sp. IHB B 3415 TaxID=867080 RepID=UPI000574FE68|nr:SDR family oxidoreductase [Paenibacillus sp. IHB B 3415]KHL96523.1 short-chain dehydrogenase [Paenibacillus sp. IHB B 3415]
MLTGQKIVIIGGSSGIGLETAKLAAGEGAEIIIASRSAHKLEQARAKLGTEAKVSTYTLDITDEAQVQAFFAELDDIDHLVVTAAETSGGAFLSTATSAARQLMDNKFWGQYYAAKYAAPKLRPAGSVTLFSGIVAFKSMTGSSMLGAVNAAVANLARTLALELAPLRVNAVSPGIIDTPSRAGMAEEARTSFYSGLAAKLPAQRVGTAADVAQGVLYLMHNSFVTGTVLHIEGGHGLI